VRLVGLGLRDLRRVLLVAAGREPGGRRVDRLRDLFVREAGGEVPHDLVAEGVPVRDRHTLGLDPAVLERALQILRRERPALGPQRGNRDDYKREEAERAGIEIRYYNIIYNLVDDVKAAMSGLLAPTLRETMLGNAQILEVFNISKVGKVAGCRVTDGTVERGANVRLIRDNVVVHEGKLSTLKRFKDEVKEVQSGQECGMAFENYGDMRVGDVIECYRVETIQRSL